MEKKIYNCPMTKIVDLQAMDVTMQHVFGPASMPTDPHASAPKRKTEVF